MNENNNWRTWGAGEWLAMLCKVLVGLIVIAFLALHTVNFFTFVFPPEQIYYAYMGLGLTGGAVIAYLVILKWGAKSSLNKTIAIVMLAVSAIGELLAAGFGMQVEGFKNSGLELTSQDLSFMIRVIQVLGGFHALALIMSFAGDEIMDAFVKKASVSATSAVSTQPFVLPASPKPSVNEKDFTD